MMFKNFEEAARQDEFVHQVELFNNENQAAMIQSKKINFFVGLFYIVINIAYLAITHKAIPIYFLLPYFVFLIYHQKSIHRKKNKKTVAFNLKHQKLFDILAKKYSIPVSFFELKPCKSLYYQPRNVIFSNFYESHKNSGEYYFYEMSKQEFKDFISHDKKLKMINLLSDELEYASNISALSNIFPNKETFITFTNLTENYIIGFKSFGDTVCNEKVKDMLIEEIKKVIKNQKEVLDVFHINIKDKEIFDEQINLQIREIVLNEKMDVIEKEDGKIIKAVKKAKV